MAKTALQNTCSALRILLVSEGPQHHSESAGETDTKKETEYRKVYNVFETMPQNV
jgi:hypothetical protein